MKLGLFFQRGEAAGKTTPLNGLRPDVVGRLSYSSVGALCMASINA